MGGHTQLVEWGDGKVIRLYREAWITCINMRAAANYRPAAEGAFYLNLSPKWAAAAVTCWSGHLGVDLNNIAAGGRQLSFAGSQVNLGHVSQRSGH